MSENLLVIAMPGRMGDIVAAEPLFRKLHALHPDRKIHFYTGLPYAGLVRSIPYFEKIVPFKLYLS